MIMNFIAADADTAHIPDRLRSKGWLTGAVRFTWRVLNSLKTIVTARLQPPPPSLLDPQVAPDDLGSDPDVDLEYTTALTPTNPDWYLFFAVSPPLTLRGNHHG